MRLSCILTVAIALHATPMTAAEYTALPGSTVSVELPCNFRRFSTTPEELLALPDFGRRCYEQARARMERTVSNDVQLYEADMEVRSLLEVDATNAYGWTAFAELHLRYEDLGLRASPAKVLELAGRATRLKPAIPEAHLARAEAFWRLGCLSCAGKAVQAAQRLAPKHPQVLLADALVLAETGATDAAQRFEAALAALPAGQSRAIARLRWGALALRAGKMEAAEEAFAAAVTDAPDLLRAHLRYAHFLLQERGDAEGTIRAVQRAGKVRPSVEAKRLSSMAAYLKWAERYEQTGETGELTKIAQRAIIAPEEAFVSAAGHPRLAAVTRALGKSKAVKNVNERDGAGNTALIVAAGGADVALMRLLLDLGADVNAQNSRGERALTFAAERGDPKVVTLLLSGGAQPGFADQDGSSPLSLAVDYQHVPVIQLLLERGAKLEGPGADSAELLWAACRNADLPSVDILLAHGANPNAASKEAMPPLVAAVVYGSLPIVRRLLAKGADPRVRFEGRSVMDYARDTGDWEVLKALEARVQGTI